MKIYLDSKGEEHYRFTKKELKGLKPFKKDGIALEYIVNQAIVNAYKNNQIIISKKYQETLDLETRLLIGL